MQSIGAAEAVCPLCTERNTRLVYDMTEPRRPTDVPGHIVRCASCGMWFKALAQTTRVEDAYGEQYVEWDGSSEYFESEAARQHFRSVLAGLAAPVTNRTLRLLDVGSGGGIMIEEAHRAGFDAEGIDLCEPLVERGRARGLRVHHGRIEDFTDMERFDVVTMMDLIEHVPNPLEVMNAVRELLVPGGLFVCYTPNHRAAIVLASRLMHGLGLEFATREIFGSNHVCFFDDRTFPAMLDKAGFELERCELSPYDPARPGAPVSTLMLAAVTAIETMGRPLGRVFRMLTLARNPNPSSTA